MKFNRGYAAPNWDYARLDEPDVVCMAWKGWPEGGRDEALGSDSGRRDHARSDRYYADYGQASRTPAERRVLENLAKHEGRPLTVQEENLAIEQAKAIGYLLE